MTGGSRGLGLQIAEALGERCAKIVLSSRKQADLDEAVTHLKVRGTEASAIAADLPQDAEIVSLVVETLKRLGHIDILGRRRRRCGGGSKRDAYRGLGAAGGRPKLVDQADITMKAIMDIMREIGAASVNRSNFGVVQK